jgi:hypothetical protein
MAPEKLLFSLKKKSHADCRMLWKGVMIVIDQRKIFSSSFFVVWDRLFKCGNTSG